jgi:molybdopterin-guanine dinucleotide biosynthesis protein A
MTKQTGLAAAILAGGRARRLGGANKATLVLGGAQIVDRQLAVLRDVASSIFVVGPDAPVWSARGLVVVPDDVPDAGALGGILTAITRSPCDRTLVVACDMPFLSADLLGRMAAMDADLVIPKGARGYEPLCAVYSRACAADIRARIARGALEASALPHGVRVAELGPELLAPYDPDGLLFVNVNTPHDYERAKGLIELKPEPTEDRITTGDADPRQTTDS